MPNNRNVGRRRLSVVIEVGLVLALAAATFVARPSARAHAINMYTSRTTTIAPGVTFTKVVTGAPNHIFYLKIAPGASATLDTTLARGGVMPGWQKTSTMVANDKGIAGVNGDFGLYPGRPAHIYSENGQLIQSDILSGNNFAVTQNKAKVHISSPKFTVTATETSTATTFAVNQWNTTPLNDPSIGGYTAAGGSIAPPPKGTCSARLLPSGKQYWAPNKNGVSRDYTVDAVACGASAMSLNGGVILAANTSSAKANTIKALTVGQAVSLTWTMGWPDVLDTVGGNPQLVSKGVVTVKPCSQYLCWLQPRTAVGVTAKGDILLVVIDGRQSGYSVGMTLVQEAMYMKSLGAVWALNLDGGGSSTMVVKGKVMNRPSDGTERYVSNALVVLPGLDPNDPIMTSTPASVLAPQLSTQPLPGVSPNVSAQAWQMSLTDPGSAGGLLAYAQATGSRLTPQETGWLSTFRMAEASTRR